MKRIISWLFGLLALALAASAVMFTVRYLNAPPVLVRVPEAAVEQVDAVMTAVCSGDYAAASRGLYGSPDLGADREPAEAVGVLIWDAFVDSTSYELVGECFVTEMGLAQNVRFSGLELESVTEKAGGYAQTLLQQRVEEATDPDQLYDEKNNYREDLVMEVLYEAVQQALRQDARYTEQELTLNLIYKQGQWWVMPDQALLSAISGGIAG